MLNICDNLFGYCYGCSLTHCSNPLICEQDGTVDLAITVASSTLFIKK